MLMTNKVPYLKPTLSNRIPAADGPMKAPKENEADHKPDSIPYVPMSSLKPAELQ